MAIVGDSLRQAFMPKREYDGLREEQMAWGRLQRPLVLLLAGVVCVAVVVAVSVSLAIVFPGESSLRPFCRDRRFQALPLVNMSVDDAAADSYHGTFYLTDEEAADYYWMVVFVPSAIVFAVSAAYLLSGMIVAYYAPTRHPCLKVVENNYCASKRGGVRCLSILNIVLAVVFGLMALFLGSSLLTLGSSWSIPLFWCYEIASWGLVILYVFTSFFLRRKAAVILDESDFSGRNLGLELSESVVEVLTLESCTLRSGRIPDRVSPMFLETDRGFRRGVSRRGRSPLETICRRMPTPREVSSTRPLAPRRLSSSGPCSCKSRAPEPKVGLRLVPPPMLKSVGV